MAWTGSGHEEGTKKAQGRNKKETKKKETKKKQKERNKQERNKEGIRSKIMGILEREEILCMQKNAVRLF